MPPVTHTAEYKTFKYLQHWQREENLEKLKSSFSQISPFFSYLLQKTAALYGQLPPRRDGQNPFLHPLNVVLALTDANSTDEATLSVGLLHDYVEEMVDMHQHQQRLGRKEFEMNMLENYEENVFGELEKDLLQHGETAKVKTILEALKLLTRHKRDFYYRSISQIFQYPDEKIKEIAIQVKLADRMHNILSIGCFTEEERIYQCFKNLFILNNTKKYLLEKPEERISKTKDTPSTQLLFKRCSKATYDAFLTICHLCLGKGLRSINSMIQLAFKKFALEKAGVWEVTTVDPDETHLMRLFHGVVRKYDARLHQEWTKFEELKESEYEYCRRFFADFNFSEEQIRTIIDYKDAYSLKEVVAYLLYLPEYVVYRFLSSDLSEDARICG